MLTSSNDEQMRKMNEECDTKQLIQTKEISDYTKQLQDHKSEIQILKLQLETA